VIPLRPALHLIALAPLLLALAPACGPQGAGIVEGGPLVVADCTRRGALARFEPFELDLGFMALERDADVVVMRFQRDAELVPLTDTFTLTIDDYSVVKAEIATAGSTSRSIAQGLHVGMTLTERCPAATAAMLAHFAHATFERLSVDGGQRVTFTAVFDLFDERSGEQIGWNLSAAADFEVLLGTPYQQFSDPSSQEHKN
jgi:hypothetical protein